MKSKTKHSPVEEFIALPDDEKEQIVAEFDTPFIADSFGPLTPAQQTAWRRAKRLMGRPKVGKGARRISRSVELGLLGRSDKMAKKLGVSRSQLVARGLEVVLAGKVTM
jgi:hypothetical protein